MQKRTMGRRGTGALVATGACLAMATGCGPAGNEPVSWLEATGSPEVPVTATVALAEFEGYANPSTGEFSVQVVRTFDPHVQLQAIYEGHGLRTIGQAGTLVGPGGPAAEPAPWCTGRVVNDGTAGSNPVDTFELYTDPATIAAALPGDPIPPVCAVGNQAQYPGLGVFCATVRAMNFNTMGWSEVHAQLYKFDGSPDLKPYSLGQGTSVVTVDELNDGETLPQYTNLPDPGDELALWRYGDLAADGGSATQVWSFQNASQAGGFNFRGRVIGHVAENCDTPDINEDCDPLGRGDNACRLYLAGAECTHDSDCLSMLCTDDVCADGCRDGLWGASCQYECPGGYANACSGNGVCNDGNAPSADGTCVCDANFYGADCSVGCDADEVWSEATGCEPRKCPDGLLDFYGDGVACIGVDEVSVGTDHSCAIADDGTLWCWGANDRGQLGVGDTVDRAEATQVAGEWADWTAVEVGAAHTCGLRGASTLYCWGDGTFGQLGNGTSGAAALASSPSLLAGSGWTAVSAGAQHTCALRAGEMFCWGLTSYGRLGVPVLRAIEPAPDRAVQGGASWVSVDVGTTHSCGIRAGAGTERTLWCWGEGFAGQLGRGSTLSSETPVVVSSGLDGGGSGSPISPADDADADGVPDAVDECPGTRAGREVDLAGCDVYCEVVIGGGANPSVFLRTALAEVGVAAAGSFGTTDNAPAAWHARPGGGGPRLGLVADPNDTGWTNFLGDFFLPGTPEEGFGLTVNGVSAFNAQAMGTIQISGQMTGVRAECRQQVCGRRGGATAHWSGLYNGIQIAKSYSVVNPGREILIEVALTNTTAASRDVYYMRNIDPDNVAATTSNYSTTNRIVSQGDGTESSLALVRATTSSPASYLALASADPDARVTYGGFSNRSAQGVWTCSGLVCSPGAEQTGDQAISLAVRKTIPAGATVRFSYAYAFAPDYLEETLRCASPATCGDGEVTGAEACDDGNTVGGDGCSADCRVEPWSDWEQLSAGHQQTCGVRSDGTAWCWGSNASGKLGNGGIGIRLLPSRVVGTGIDSWWSDWTQVQAGGTIACGTRDSGSVYCWGSDASGGIGDGPGDSSSNVPRRVGSITAGFWSDWRTLAVGDHSTCGVRDAGTLYCWGSGSAGQLATDPLGADQFAPAPSLATID